MIKHIFKYLVLAFNTYTTEETAKLFYKRLMNYQILHNNVLVLCNKLTDTLISY